MSSFAIAVRVFDGEAPYLQSFIYHHRRLGVDAFYPVLAPREVRRYVAKFLLEMESHFMSRMARELALFRI